MLNGSCMTCFVTFSLNLLYLQQTKRKYKNFYFSLVQGFSFYLLPFLFILLLKELCPGKRLSKISVTSITQGSEIFKYDKFTMLGFKSGTNSQIWVKLDIIMQKIRSRVLMDSEKHISEWVQQVKNMPFGGAFVGAWIKKSIKKQKK